MDNKIFLKRILPIGLASIFVSFLFAWIQYSIVMKSTNFSLLDLWSGWDGQHYLEIAHDGYVRSGANAKNIAFFPFYPILIWAVDFFFDSPRFTALLLSNSFLILALYWFYNLVRLDFDERTANWSLIWMVVFPTAYFLHAIYPESPYLALSIGAFLYFRRGNYWWGGVLAMLACFTRPQGVVLVSALLVECWLSRKSAASNGSRFRQLTPWLACGIAGLGIVGYFAVNYAVFGSFFKFMDFQKANWGRQFASPFIGLALAWERLFTIFRQEPLWAGIFEITAAAIGMLVTIASARWLRASYTTYVLLAWLLVICNSFWLSQPRHLLCLFPLYICLALSFRRQSPAITVAVGLAILQAFFLAQFDQWHWAF